MALYVVVPWPCADCQDIKLVLPDTTMNADIPKEFTINMTNRKVTNTYVFSEKDINIKKEASSSTLPNVNNRYAPYPKIPPSILSLSHICSAELICVEATSIVGTVAHECTITPVMNASYSKTVKSRVQEANQPRRQVQIISEQNGIPSDSYLYNPSKNQPFGKFTGGTQRSKSESQHNKATRIPKNELLDLLFKCFQEYEYWSLKGLREYVKQPESYLREALEEIAHLNKRGPYALKWSLKPHYKQSQELSSGTRESVGGAKKEEDGFGTPSMKTEPDNGDNVKMEDVL